MTLCPSGQGDGLEIYWALPAGVRIPSLSKWRKGAQGGAVRMCTQCSHGEDLTQGSETMAQSLDRLKTCRDSHNQAMPCVHLAHLQVLASIRPSKTVCPSR